VQLDGSKHVEPLQNSIPEAAVIESEKKVSLNDLAFFSIAMALGFMDWIGFYLKYTNLLVSRIRVAFVEA